MDGRVTVPDKRASEEERAEYAVSEVTKPEPAKPPKRVAVRVVEPRAKAVVVEVKSGKEWYRAIIPAELVDAKGTVAEPDLAAGRYGEDWASMVDAKDFPERLAEALRAQGIFSFEELHKNVNNARAAVATAHGRTLADLIRFRQKGA